MPTDAVAVLLGFRHEASASQLLARLRRAGLVACETIRPGPLIGGRTVRLWSCRAIV